MSAKIGRLLAHPGVPVAAEDWGRLPGRFGFGPAQEAEWRDLLAALRRAIDEVLSPRQGGVFVAIVLNNVPLDTLVGNRPFPGGFVVARRASPPPGTKTRQSSPSSRH